MGNVLEFTLGLEASKFLDGIGLAKGVTLGFAAVGEAVGKVFEKAWAQIEKGAALHDLSKRTGESVASLFMLQKGFKAAGLSADGVGSALFMMNKALGGVNEAGESTADVFQRAGLSVEALKKAGSGGAMTAILGKMGGMDQPSATKFASSVFGRGEAGNMVQLSRSMGEFTEGMKAAKEQGMGFQRVAALFDDIEKALARVKAKLDPLFLTIASKLGPHLKTALDWINHLDLSKVNKGIEDMLDIIIEAFQEGKIPALITAALNAAFEQSGNFAYKIFSGVAAAIETRFKQIPGELNASMGNGMRAFGGLLGANVARGISEALTKQGDAYAKIGNLKEAQSFYALASEAAEAGGGIAETAKDDLKNRGRSQLGMMGKNALETLNSAKEGFSSAGNIFGTSDTDALRALAAGLLGRARAKNSWTPEKPGGGQGSGMDILGGSGHGPGATAIEKIGFVFGGGMVTDHAATTAKNTTKLVQLTEQVVAAVSPKAGGLPTIYNSHA